MNDALKEGLSQQFSNLVNNLPKGGELPGQDQLKALLQGAFSKMDLVSREEFDAQSAVLQRTRAKVEALEKRLDELEQQLSK
ncbi:MAG: accessory factor UbiK family protein [Pseudomonadales bacterium]